MAWQETTLRKGTKYPKICRDQYVCDSRGYWTECLVRNGRIFHRKHLTESQAKEIIKTERLVKCETIFNNCFTYRTTESAKLIDKLIRRGR